MPGLNVCLCCSPDQCDLQASDPGCGWSATKTKWILAGWVPRAAQRPHWEPLLLWVFLQSGQHRVFEQSASPTRLPVHVVQAPAPCCGGWFSLLRLPEPGCRSNQRPPGQHHRPPSGCCEQRSHLPGYQQRCYRERRQVKTLSSLSPCPRHLLAAYHSTPQLKQ